MPRISLPGFTVNCDVVPATLPMDTLFIHGNLASNRWWRPALAAWNRDARPGLEGRAILAEWRGCGQSSEPASEAELAPEVLADDYIRLLENLKISKACVVGHSTGGLIALRAMMKRPDLFHRAVLLNSVAADGARIDSTRLDAYARMGRDRAYCAEVLGAIIHGSRRDDPFFQELVSDAYGISKHNWLGVPRALANVDVTSLLHKVRAPVLVAHGELDSVLPIEKSKTMALGLGNGVFQEIKGQGHCPNVENPELFVRICNEFLFQH